ncbi:MAG: MBL fold metallo-hydrolase [Albidovulum sp.]|nr:MBL fold metallo-hydrolase [Albidovulum sp.]
MPGVLMFKDSCNVYAVEGENACVVIDAGTGKWLEHIGQLPQPPGALLCTHFFRDHSAGAAEAARRGIPVYIPEGEREFFEEPQEHFRRRETYIMYENLWDLFAPLQSLEADGVLWDYDKISLCGLEFEIFPLPGASVGQIGISCRVGASGAKAIFCGETIHSPGKVPRVAPYQYNYLDLNGGFSAYYSLNEILVGGFDAVLPSLGIPLLANVEHAIQSTKRNLSNLLCAVPHEPAKFYWESVPDRLHNIDNPRPLIRVSESVWLDQDSSCRTWYIRSERGKVLSIDYGYHNVALGFVERSAPQNRRALLHHKKALISEFGTDAIDVVLVSHFHDDHVAAIPILRRLYGTRCAACSTFSHLLEEPEAHRFPCNWPRACKVDHSYSVDDVFRWEEFEFHFAPMSGHTRFSALIGFEADGLKFAHTGDQYGFAEEYNSIPPGRSLISKHVYRNGALRNGFHQSADWLLGFRPDVILSGHCSPKFTDDAFFEEIRKCAEDYRQLHEELMPLGENDAHFDLDSMAGWIWPYRSYLAHPGKAKMRVRARNPFADPSQLELRLVDANGNRGDPEIVDAAARQEVECTLEIEVDDECKRRVVAVELIVNGIAFGQIAEAMITVGGKQF